MPVYEYRCEKCGKDFDLFVRSAAQRNDPKCPQCGSPRVKKTVSLFGVGTAGGRSGTGASCGTGPI
ncbi:MAG: zinc ribbon domain-containing protein [Anaerolineae bacterium]